MADNIIYSSEFQFYCERVIAAHQRQARVGARSVAELVEAWLRQHGVVVVDDRFDRESPRR